MVKRRATALLLLLFTLLFLFVGFSSVKAAESRVFDDAKLFTDEEITQLNNQIAALKEELEQDLVIVTTDDTQGYTAQEYADNYYDRHHFGVGIDDSGALLLIDMEHRTVYISTCGEMIDYLTEDRIDSLLADAVTSLKSKEYYSAASLFLNSTRAYVLSDIPEYPTFPEYPTLPAYPNHPTEHNETSAFSHFGIIIVISVIVAIAVGAICCGIIAATYNMAFSFYQYPFRQKSRVQLTRSEDYFRNRTLHRRHIDPPNHGGPHGGSGVGHSHSHSHSTHTSSGGVRHGGGGASF